MKKIDGCVGKYSISKTLRFRAVPVGKTLENIQKKQLIQEDEKRASQFKDVKKLMDRYHAAFIKRILANVTLSGLNDYVELFKKGVRTADDAKKIKEIEKNLRKQISDAFINDGEYKGLFEDEMIKKYLPKFLEDEEDKKKVSKFEGFSTAFKGFNTNRKNLYSKDEKSTAIAYRCINENLPRFVSNMMSFDKIKEALPSDDFERINAQFNHTTFGIEDCFVIDFFNFALAQEGIDCYNAFLGGFVAEDGTKVQGLNEYINLFNQQFEKEEKGKKLPKMKPLYKQILGEGKSVSFYTEGFSTDEEVYDAIRQMYAKISGESNGIESGNKDALLALKDIFENLSEYEAKGIYLKNGPAFTSLSKSITGEWSALTDAWNADYDAVNAVRPPRDYEKYDKKRKKAFKSIESFSLEDIKNLANNCEGTTSVFEYYKNAACVAIERIEETHEKYRQMSEQANKGKPLPKDDEKIVVVKDALDAVKSLESLVKPLLGTGKEEGRDEVFYGEFMESFEQIRAVDDIYDKVRNYVTKKPYSKEKYKLWFQNPKLMDGWDKNTEAANRATILRKDGLYYVAVIDKSNSKSLVDCPAPNGKSFYEKMNYKLLGHPHLDLPKAFFTKKGLEVYQPPEKITSIYEKKSFTKGVGFSKEDCSVMIDFYKEAIQNHPDWSTSFNFNFLPSDEYKDISEFYNDVARDGYRVYFDKVDEEYINNLVEEGKIYLFQLYNKDFSPKSHGRKNLHTLYFLNLFDEENLKNPTSRLNGGAEMFYRRASIGKDEMVVHPAKQPIQTKNPLNSKGKVTFEYDIVKDKRYTEDQFFFHVPITMNSTPTNTSDLNLSVRQMLKKDENPYVIGIDRGERNLIYICVIDSKGRVVEQISLNEIINENDGVEYRTDYHALLDQKEKERKEARQNWTTIENIKELKEGYISQVVHKICQLVEKYDAVIALEDLNSGFKNSRVKVEKQVYQKFEKMLIEKLNYMVNKETPSCDNGGVKKGYQLTNAFESFQKMKTQNGIMFYIPAWLTSKIDPATGFVDLLKPKYKNLEDARKFIRSFDKIYFDSSIGAYAFSFNYDSFERTDADYKRSWTIYTKGERIRTFRNPNKNNEWDNETVDLTASMRELFERYNVDDKEDNIISGICSIEDVDFYKQLLGVLKLTLQMRNSITGRVDVDYLISPVPDCNGRFYDSRDYEKMDAPSLPANADANGAYNIARKVLWAIQLFKDTDDDQLKKANIAISNKEWLRFAQTNCANE